ncbi:MAG: hypothetical protein IPM53_22485 [Anaerolineaceae bacterium]|nr:hypothetical protein [Anaerolineaceae bacterium]
MNQARITYHIARADFLERVRRYSFLITLGSVVFVGYQVAIGNLNMQAGDYRGEYNSAWVGSMMAIIASFFLGWFGFYLVKGSIARDRQTSVGQIMAATSLTRPLYTFGKWLSNLAVLMAMVVVLAVVGIGLQLLAGESYRIDLVAFLPPLLFIALPMLALVAAIAVLFESVRFLQGGFGNILYFFMFAFIFPLADWLSNRNPALEPLGFALLQQSMNTAAKAEFPESTGGFVLGSTGIPIKGIFHWSGVDWTTHIVLNRLLFLAMALVLALVAAFLFDRFDTSLGKPDRKKRVSQLAQPEAAAAKRAAPAIRLTPLNATPNGFAFARIFFLELKLLLKGVRWWWFVGAGGLFIASLTNTPENVRAFVLPITWLWPTLIWSSLGNRELRHNVSQMVFSSAFPLMRQLPAAWLAGFTVAVVTGSGAAIRFLGAGDSASLLVWVSAALFIPTLALALGVLSNGRKLFEVLHVSLWYLALNKVAAVDYFGANSSGNVGFFMPLTLILLVIAFIGRARQLQN